MKSIIVERGGSDSPLVAEVARSVGRDGVPGAIRTPGLQLRRLTLYPAELQAHYVSELMVIYPSGIVKRFRNHNSLQVFDARV